MSWQVTRRKVQPAQVIVFAKKPPKSPPRPPETQTVIMEEVVTTALDLSSEAGGAENTVTAAAEGTVTVLAPPPAPSPAPARTAGKKPRRTRSSTNVPKVIISKGDTPAEEPESLEATNDLLTLGHALFEKGKVREAKIIFEGLSLSLPNDAFVQTMLGTVCLALNELPKAMDYFEAALALDPGDIAARVYRGELRLHRRRLRPAIEDFEYAIAHGAGNDPFVERAHRLLKMAKKPARR